MNELGRRDMLKASGVLIGAAALSFGGGAVADAAAAPAARGVGHPYFPSGAACRELYVVDESLLSAAEGVLVGTLQGLVARGRSARPVVPPGLPLVYLTKPDSPTALWLSDLSDRYGIHTTSLDSAWQLLAAYLPRGPRPGITGYIRYDDDPSLSVATTLAGITGSVAVHASIADQAAGYGLLEVADVSGRDDTWLKANYWSRVRHDFAIEQKPSFTYQLRDLATMTGATLFYDGNDAFREDLVTSLDADSPIIGWGDATNGEEAFVAPSSAAGTFMVAADWAQNLSTLSGVPSGPLRQQPDRPIHAEQGVHYVTFAVTDGDNLQWLLTSLQNDPNWWSSPDRGTVPLGWGIPPTAVDLAPSVLRWYYDNASPAPNADQFTVGPSGSGYMYPSEYPADRLLTHTDRLARYMALADVGIAQILDFEALDKVSVWDSYTQRAAINGLFYLEYSRYDSQAGRVIWSHDKPVISARHMLWAGLAGADEPSVTAALNAAPRDPTSTDGYSLVMAHAWSKGIQNIRTVTDQLDPAVRVVTPGEFVRLMTENVVR